MNDNKKFWYAEGYTPSEKGKVLIFDRKQLKYLVVYFTAALIVGIILSRLSYEGALSALRVWAMINQAVMITTIISNIATKQFTLERQLPLHLCSVNVILTSFFVWSLSERLFDFIFTYSMVGAMLALLIPDTDGGRYPRFSYRSLEYYFSHTSLVFLPIYARLFLKVPYLNANIIHTLAVFVSFCIVNYIINLFLHSNYFFIMHAPNGSPVVGLEKKCGAGVYRIIYICFMSVLCVIVHLLAAN